MLSKRSSGRTTNLQHRTALDESRAGDSRRRAHGAPPPPRAARDHGLLFTVAGPKQGSVFPLHTPAVRIGRDGEADMNLADNAVSTRHARLTMAPSGTYVRDLGSRNGTFVNGRRIHRRCRLVDGDRLRLGNTILKFSLLDELEERALTGLFELTVRDPLTRAYNRRYLTEQLPGELAFSARRGAPLSLLLIDIDRFKSINDAHGHLVGDLVLQAVAANLQRLLRPCDVLCRFGGEEFVVVARDTSPRNAQILAERMRRRVAGATLPLGRGVCVTISVGVVSVRPSFADQDVDGLLDAADKALYAAKAAGRNRVIAGHAPTAVSSGPSERCPAHTVPPCASVEAESEAALPAPCPRLPPLPSIPEGFDPPDLAFEPQPTSSSKRPAARATRARAKSTRRGPA